MNQKSVAVERSDALEQYAYAAVVEDVAGMRDALARLDDARPATSEPTADVKAAFIEADPVGAAALGWVTFYDLLQTVRENPDAYLDAAEASAFRNVGENVLRTIVAYRALGKTFGSEIPGHAHLGKGNLVLAARGRVLDQDALLQILKENGVPLAEGEPEE